MKKHLLFIAFILSITACEFGSKKPAIVEVETPDSIPAFVEYRIEVLNEKSGPCEQDSLSSQCTTYAVEYPVITGMISEQAQAEINENIKSAIFDYAFLTEKPESFQSLIDELSAEYTSILKEFPDYRSSWSMEINSDIIHQDSSFISVASTIYSYTGGAHPNQYQVYRSYDLQTGKAIRLSDILSSGFEEELNQAAEIEFRMLKEIPPNEELKDRGYFFKGGNFVLNDNFAIINKSLIFYFNPYEIAPYAIGSTELELRLTDYINLLNENGVLNGLKN